MTSETGDRGDQQARTRAMWTGAVVALLIAAFVGCTTQKETPAPTENPNAVVGGADTLLGAKHVTIKADGSVDIGTTHLSKSARGVVQWQNSRQDTVMLLFDGAPIGELIPPGRWSAPFHVCLSCSTGSYHYVVYKRGTTLDWVPAESSNPPTQPDVFVDN